MCCTLSIMKDDKKLLKEEMISTLLHKVLKYEVD